MATIAHLAESGSVDAQYLLGCAYAAGDGVVKDLEQATYWLRLAAEQGHPLAQYSVARNYHTGAGVEENISEAVRFYQLAAGQNHPDANFALHNLYLRGIGVRFDAEQAHRHLCDAAACGHEGARVKLTAIDLMAAALVPGQDIDVIADKADQQDAKSLFALAALKMFQQAPDDLPFSSYDLLEEAAACGSAPAQIAFDLLIHSDRDAARTENAMRKAACLGSKKAICFLVSDLKSTTARGQQWAEALRRAEQNGKRILETLAQWLCGEGMLDPAGIEKVRSFIEEQELPALF